MCRCMQVLAVRRGGFFCLKSLAGGDTKKGLADFSVSPLILCGALEQD